MKKFPVALQLYSVRDAMTENADATLKAVAEMGYHGVEFAGLYGHTPEEMRALCKKYGLEPISAHVAYNDMLGDPEKVIGDYASIGCRYIAIPWFRWDFNENATYEDFIKNVRMLGAVAKSKGMTLLYHNHDFEFEKMNGKYRLDCLYSDVSPELLETELDVCWVNVGGENPATYIRQYDGRTPVVHLKDFAGQKSDKMYALIGVDDGDQKEETKQAFEFRPVGYGLQKFPEILEAATASGAEWVVVEQDQPSMGKTPLECAALSREYLKTLVCNLVFPAADVAKHKFQVTTEVDSMASKDSLDAFKENQEEAVIDASKKLRVGIIGCGWIAGAHLNALLKQPDVDIVAGCDLVPGKAAKFFADHGVENVKTAYKNHADMLADKSLNLDAVCICTYNRQHANCAIAALQAGINVMLEKPMCVTTEEAVDIIRAEKKSGKVLSIGFQPRMDANMKKIKEIVDSGVLGKIYYIQTGGGRRRGIPTPFGTTFIEDKTAGLGALADIGCYSLDMVLNAIGYPKPLTVSGYKSDFFGKNPNYVGYGNHHEYADLFGVDDFAAAFIRLEGGIILDFRIAWAMNLDTPGDTIIMGTEGSLRIPSTECWNGSTGGPMTIYHEVAGSQVETVIPTIPMKEDLFCLKIRTFLDACKNGTPAPVPSSQILYNQAILDGIAKSSIAGREIEINIPEI